jgi:hypothetical protein
LAQLPRRLASHLKASAAAALLWAFWPAAASAVELTGTWHVLVHYRDSKAANSDAERWEDRLWAFEAKEGRLRWTEYPIVIFDDETGRFERRAGTGQYARLLHFWEPSPEQLANIRVGLAANDRGAETKTLRQLGGAWSSGARASATGAAVITYQETWSIEQPEGLPVFLQVDVLGSESAEELEGKTELRTEQVLEGGDLLVGRFERDGTRVGTFAMRRSGARKALRTKTQAELQAQAFQRSLESSEEVRLVLDPLRRDLSKDGIELDETELAALLGRAQRLLDQGKTPDEARHELEQVVRSERGGTAPKTAP